MKGLLNNSTNPSGHRNDHLNTIYFDNDLSHYYNAIQSYNVDDVQSYIKNDTLLRNNDSRRYDNNRSTQSKYASYHVYQRSADRNKVFLSGKDAIVFISVVKIKSIKWAVHIYAICLMDNHIHMLIKVRDKATLCRFVAEYTSLFTRIYNKRHNRYSTICSIFSKNLICLLFIRVRPAIFSSAEEIVFFSRAAISQRPLSFRIVSTCKQCNSMIVKIFPTYR